MMNGTAMRLFLVLTCCVWLLPADLRAQTFGADKGYQDRLDDLTWEQLEGRALDISLGARDIVYVVARNQSIWRWRNDRGWQRFSGKFRQVTVAGNGKPWAVDRKGQLRHFNGLWWERVGIDALDVGRGPGRLIIAVGQDGSLLIGDADNRKAGWLGVAFDGFALHAMGDSENRLWVVDDRQQVYRQNEDRDGWDLLPGAIQDIDISPNGQHVMAVGADGSLGWWDEEKGNWQLVNDAPDLIAVALDEEGLPWFVASDGDILAEAGALKEAEKEAPPEAPRATVVSNDAEDISEGDEEDSTAESNDQQAAAAAALAATTGSADAGAETPSGTVSTDGADAPPLPPALQNAEDVGVADHNLRFRRIPKTEAYALAIGAEGSVYAVGTGGAVLRWNNGSNKFFQFPGLLSRIAVSGAGQIWGIGIAGAVYVHDGTDWRQIGGIENASDIAANINGNVVISTTTDGIYRFSHNNDRFERVPRINGRRVGAGVEGVWVARSDGLLRACNFDGKCRNYGNNIKDVKVGPAGRVFAIDARNRLLRLDLVSERFHVVAKYARSVAVGFDGFPWITDKENQVQYTAKFKRDESGDLEMARNTKNVTIKDKDIAATVTVLKDMTWEQVDDAKDIVQGGLDGSVITWKVNQPEIFEYDFGRKRFKESKKREFPNGVTSSQAMVIDKNGRLWIAATDKYSIFREKVAGKGDYEEYKNLVKKDENAGFTNGFQSMAIGADGTIIAHNDENELWVYNEQRDRFEFEIDESPIDGFSIQVDAAGIFHAISSTGQFLVRYNGRTWQKLDYSPTGFNGLFYLNITATGEKYMLAETSAPTNVLIQYNAARDKWDRVKLDRRITGHPSFLMVTPYGQSWIFDSGSFAFFRSK